MPDLTSARNAAVKAARQLARRRGPADRLLVEAPAAVDAAVAASALAELFVLADAAAEHQSRMDAAARAGARVRTVTAPVLDALADTRSPQGVVGVAQWPEPGLADAVDGASLVVAAVDCGDPGNVGTIVRTADAGGADAVLLVGACADPRGPKAVRASAGSLFHLPVVRTAWDDAHSALRRAGLQVLAASAHGGVAYTDCDWTARVAVMLGSEAHGLPAQVIADADTEVVVPLRGRAESLNVAAAAAVLVFEAARQRAAAPPRRARGAA